ncbi:hypothetical protein [Kosakonia phage 305]|uniref:Head outer capsid protein n=1 Tax=Kosakonia phage 305 TaxID=2863193 RepID=A0AAE7WG73_9CAUD|nr:Hoc-like head decoration [Kosakonia phage 305]QYN80355.1 hypothetical protein [Kosakonia phage 305]
MELLAVLSEDQVTLEYGDDKSISVEVIGDIPEKYNLEYEWGVNKLSTGFGTSTRTLATSRVGKYSTQVRVWLKAEGEDPIYIQSNDCQVEVIKSSDTSGVEMQVVYSDKIYKIGETVVLEASTIHPDPNFVMAAVWKDGQDNIVEIGPTYNRELKSNTEVVSCKINAESMERVQKYDTVVVYIRAEDGVIPDEDGYQSCIRYIHPLDYKDSAFIWCGWWVMDEIERATALGLDWKTGTDPQLKYKCDLRTIAKMLNEHTNVEIQESRHGWIVTRNMLEFGIIY